MGPGQKNIGPGQKNMEPDHENMEPGQTVYTLDPATLQVNANLVEGLLSLDEVRFRLEISALKSGGFRVKIREAFPLVPRFEVPEVLAGDPEVIQYLFI